ncbi:uncharacterized protein TNCV_3239181 [Trichonephila clavipes]|nr:uncharacterized protein TNCV_3239181 [Trichonephila clavipes]
MNCGFVATRTISTCAGHSLSTIQSTQEGQSARRRGNDCQLTIRDHPFSAARDVRNQSPPGGLVSTQTVCILLHEVQLRARGPTVGVPLIAQHGSRVVSSSCCQVIYSQFGLAIHQNDHQARRRFVEWAQNEIAVVPDFHKRILFSDEAHFWLNGYVNKQNFRIWSEANPQVYVETPLHPEKLTVWCALRAGGILLQKR